MKFDKGTYADDPLNPFLIFYSPRVGYREAGGKISTLHPVVEAPPAGVDRDR